MEKEFDPDVDRPIHFVHPITGEVLDHKGRRLTPDGREMPNPTPLAPPVGYRREKSMFDHMRELVSQAVQAELDKAGVETFEESDDFDIDDDYDPTSPWENEFEPPLAELLSEARAIQKRDAARSAGSPADGSAAGAEARPKASRQAKKTPVEDSTDEED